jgi:HD-like signal output (HDOD) protein/CheY-like chemotaxis protein
MKRILFVDDEQRILDAMRRMLHSMRGEWETVFTSSGEAALAELESAPFDVIVSDMRMPGLDGATLLTRVQERFPEVVRIVLSGHTELEGALRAVPVAHQFLAKPCDPDDLRSVIERACNLQALLDDKTIRDVIGQVDTLPSVPSLYMAVTRALADPDASVTDVARIIEQDAGMCAKVLQLVSSAFFGLPRRVTKIQDALNYLGTNMIKNVLLSVEVFRTWKRGGNLAGFSIEAQQSHALLSANIAARLVSGKRQVDDAFMAAMLHDVGKLVLAVHLEEHFAHVLSAMRERQRPMHAVEEELSGVTHAEVGAYLLGLWGLPYPIVEAVAHHHAPARVAHECFDLVGAVYVADTLAHESAGALPGATGETHEPIDQAYLEAINVADQLPSWRATATGQVGVPVGG